ncbi:MAG TPA: VWA domain-containing protein [Thermoanaerobaculia bacterium]|nr:VWA domain-containing protein [Thermoanaerobaculia bacterium]
MGQWTRIAALAAWLVVCGAVDPAHSAKPATAPPSFGELIEVNVVNVDVQVTDRDGRRVTDLRQDDFEVFEDGKRVKVTNFDVVRVETEPPPASPASSTAPEPVFSDRPPEGRPHLIVYVDNLNLDPVHRTRVLGQLRQFLKARPSETRVMLVTNNLGLKVRVPFTSDQAALDAGLRQIESLPARGATAEADRRTTVRQILEIRAALMPIEGPCGRSMTQPAFSYSESVRHEMLTAIEAMTVLINSLSGLPERKALLYVSDGIPAVPGEEVFQVLVEICSGGTASGIKDVADPDLEQAQSGLPQYRGREALLDVQRFSIVNDLNRLASHANANRVTLYMLQASGLRGTASSDAGFDFDDRLLQNPAISFVQTTNLQHSLTLLASETGGRVILNANDVTADLQKMQDDLGSYYSLGYVPEHSRDGRIHKIEVRVKRPGLRVHHRKSYRDKPAIELAVDRTLAAVYHGFEDNPLDVTIETGRQTPAEEQKFHLPIRLRIPLFKLGIFPQQDQSYRGRLRLLVSTRDEKGDVSPIRQVVVPLQIPREDILYAMGKFYEYELTLTLPKGTQHVAITVRDEGTDTSSVLSRTFEVGVGGTAAK